MRFQLNCSSFFLPMKQSHRNLQSLQKIVFTSLSIMFFTSMNPHSCFQMKKQKWKGHNVWKTEVKHPDTHQVQIYKFYDTFLEWHFPLTIPHFHKVWVYRIMLRSTLRIRIKQASVTFKFHLTIINLILLLRLSEVSHEKKLCLIGEEHQRMPSHHIWRLLHVIQLTVDTIVSSVLMVSWLYG